MMTTDEKSCDQRTLPIRDALDLLNGKWKIPIIAAMLPEGKRFKELQRDLAGITAKTLAKELRELEANQLITRTEYPTVPLTVAYALTPYSRTLEPVVAALYYWGVQHRKQIMAPPQKE
jgi:DNA-binding HxlR family transcriptional regulator